MREKLIRYAIRYQGNYNKIARAYHEDEEIEEIPLQKAITILDKEYPAQLLQLNKPPMVLFYCGNIELLKNRMIAVVGSRECSQYGMMVTRKIVEKISEEFTVVSGMAKGIDRIAHETAIKSVGVLGNGLDVSYPQENSHLYRKMKENGLLITEYPLKVRPLKYHFPFRNRIIAALAEAVIVPQAKENSGSMITVNEALNLGKEVYSVPYRLTDEDGSGCNQLIRLGANVITAETKQLTKKQT